MIINHIATQENWNKKEILDNATVLVLGSFNPFNPKGDNTDYYYGRCTNYLWRAIAEIGAFNPNKYYNNIEAKLDFLRKNKVCFLDIISSIEITEANQETNRVSDFAQTKIFTEFSDQVLFTTRTRFDNSQMNVTRQYNRDILELLDNGNIEKIIHTMGNNTIDQTFQTKWKEHRLGVNGFQGFVNSISEKNVNFIPLSYSPSGRAVRVGGDNYYNELKHWISEHLNLN